MIYNLKMLYDYMLENNVNKVNVHLNGFHNLLVGDENSFPVDHETANALQIDVDGDVVSFYQIIIA